MKLIRLYCQVSVKENHALELNDVGEEVSYRCLYILTFPVTPKWGGPFKLSQSKCLR